MLADTRPIRVGGLTSRPVRRALGATAFGVNAVDGGRRRRRAHRVPHEKAPRALPATRELYLVPRGPRDLHRRRRGDRCAGGHARARGGRDAPRGGGGRARDHGAGHRWRAGRGRTPGARGSTTTPPSPPMTPATTTAPWRSRARAWPTGQSTGRCTTNSRAITRSRRPARRGARTSRGRLRERRAHARVGGGRRRPGGAALLGPPRGRATRRMRCLGVRVYCDHNPARLPPRRPGPGAAAGGFPR